MAGNSQLLKRVAEIYEWLNVQIQANKELRDSLLISPFH
jgi:hypothetical protein